MYGAKRYYADGGVPDIKTAGVVYFTTVDDTTGVLCVVYDNGARRSACVDDGPIS